MSDSNPTRDRLLITLARDLTRKQARRRTLRQDLRVVEQDIRTIKKHMRAMLAEDHANPAWNERAPASKVFGEDR